MATIIYPQQGQGLGDLISLINAGTGIGGLVQRMRMDSQSRGNNIDGTEIVNPFSGDIKQAASSGLKNLGAAPDINMMSDQLRNIEYLKNLSPTELKSGPVTGFTKSYTEKIDDAYDPMRGIQEKMAYGVELTPEEKLMSSQFSLKKAGEMQDTAKKSTLDELRTEGQKAVKPQYDAAVSEYNKTKDYWKNVVSTNPGKFSGNADELKNKIQDSANVLIDKKLKEYWADPGNIEARSEAGRLYDRTIKSLQNIDKMHGWTNNYASTNEWLADKIRNRPSGSGTGKTEKWNLNGQTYIFPVGTDPATRIKIGYEQYKKAEEEAGVPKKDILSKGEWYNFNRGERGFVPVNPETEKSILEGQTSRDVRADIRAEELMKISNAMEFLRKGKTFFNDIGEGNTLIQNKGEAEEAVRMAMEKGIIDPNTGQIYPKYRSAIARRK